MAISRFKHPKHSVKALAAVALVSACIAGSVAAQEAYTGPGASLTPVMRLCLGETLHSEVSTPQLHRNDGDQMFVRILTRCDVRSDEFKEVKKYIRFLVDRKLEQVEKKTAR